MNIFEKSKQCESQKFSRRAANDFFQRRVLRTICPKGPSERRTEEGAAHHLQVKSSFITSGTHLGLRGINLEKPDLESQSCYKYCKIVVQESTQSEFKWIYFDVQIIQNLQMIFVSDEMYIWGVISEVYF